MGWRGALRSLNSLSKEMDREARRRRKEQEAIDAGVIVAEYLSYIERLTSVHKSVSAPIDWELIASKPAPDKPQRSTVHEKKAVKKSLEYKPGFIDRILGREKKVRNKLTSKIEKAINKDENIYQNLFVNYKKEFNEWQEKHNLARSVIEGKTEAYVDAIEKFKGLTDIAELGTQVNFRTINSKAITATLNIHGRDIIPEEEVKQLKSGKLSVRDMPKTKFNELHQDYVCSCLLRLANELFSLLPIDKILVTARDELLNTQTGYLEDQPIASVYIPRETLSKLKLDFIDPSDSMNNFVHKMNFKKTAGFSLIPKASLLELEELCYSEPSINCSGEATNL